MKIAALYARVSSVKQQLNENIASQISAIQEYAHQHDYQISPQHIYQDDGYSGARLDRPALDRLRDAVARVMQWRRMKEESESDANHRAVPVADDRQSKFEEPKIRRRARLEAVAT